MKNKNRRSKAGDTIIADDGFPCMKPGKKIVRHHKEHGLYVVCAEAVHLLDSQVEDGFLIGFTVDEH